MSINAPQPPQNQHNIGQTDSTRQPEQGADSTRTEKSLLKQIGHRLTRLLPQKARNFFAKVRFAQKLHPTSVEATPGLKGSGDKQVSTKSLSERNIQTVKSQNNAAQENIPTQKQGDLSNQSASGYESVKHTPSEFIDDDGDGYMRADQVDQPEAATPGPQLNTEGEQKYVLMDEMDEAPKSQTSSERTGASAKNVSDEPTISAEEVRARKYAAYEQILDDDDFGELDKKLTNTYSYETVKNVAQMALTKQGKHSMVFMVAQNRMQELKADQLFDQLGGFDQGADYGQIRKQAAKALNQTKYSKGYKNMVMELLDQRINNFKRS